MLSRLPTRGSIRALRQQPPTPSLLRNTTTTTTRSFRSSTTSHDSASTPTSAAAAAAAAAPTSALRSNKPVGAFRGGVFGFLLGAVGAGAGTFYYVMEEYRVSNELLTEDIYVGDDDASRSAAAAAAGVVDSHVVELYERVAI